LSSNPIGDVERFRPSQSADSFTAKNTKDGNRRSPRSPAAFPLSCKQIRLWPGYVPAIRDFRSRKVEPMG
jgi:hypothetical protein